MSGRAGGSLFAALVERLHMPGWTDAIVTLGRIGLILLLENQLARGDVVRVADHAGVERWDDSAIIVRGRFRVCALEQWSVRREYLRRLRDAFREACIEIPFPQLTVHRVAPEA